MSMKLHRARIQYVERLSADLFRMGMSSPGISLSAQPGQFYMVRVEDGIDPFLPRPFSMYRRRLRGETQVGEGDGLEILVQVVGRGTALLAEKKAGQTIHVMGPLGRGWAAPTERDLVLVGGGVGVASLVSLAEERAASGGIAAVFVGARTVEGLCCTEDFSRHGLKVFTAVERDQHLFRGTVLDLLHEHWEALVGAAPFVCACGPPGMLKAIARWSAQKHVPCQVSLESRMACGVGVCLGCAVKRPNDAGYFRTCKDGPVFDIGRIDWESLEDG